MATIGPAVGRANGRHCGVRKMEYACVCAEGGVNEGDAVDDDGPDAMPS